MLVSVVYTKSAQTQECEICNILLLDHRIDRVWIYIYIYIYIYIHIYEFEILFYVIFHARTGEYYLYPTDSLKLFSQLAENLPQFPPVFFSSFVTQK